MATEAVEYFGSEAGPSPADVSLGSKITCLKREIQFREKLYPKWIEAGRLGAKEAENELAFMRAILADYERQPWPQLKKFVDEWLQQAQRLTFLNVRVRTLTRDELIAIVAFACAALQGEKKPK